MSTPSPPSYIPSSYIPLQIPPPPSPPSSPSSSTSQHTSSTTPSPSTLSSLGLGNAIAISLAFLVLLSTLLLSFYLCQRHRRHVSTHPPTPPTTTTHLPRIIFVTEDADPDAPPDAHHSPASHGLDPAAINSYPKFPFSRSKQLHLSGGDEEGLCSICLCEYKDDEMLRLMPDCRHYFHLMCVDAWLRLNASCPVCRTSPMPTPLSTPLSELVPLSQFSADRRRRY